MVCVYIQKISDCAHSSGSYIEAELPFKLGRGSLLKWSDTKISRSHATLEEKDDKIVLTSTHSNPTFVVSNGVERCLSKGESCFIESGDEIGLLKNAYWIKMHINSVDSTCISDEPSIVMGVSDSLNTQTKEDVSTTLKASGSGDGAQCSKRGRNLPTWMVKGNSDSGVKVSPPKASKNYLNKKTAINRLKTENDSDTDNSKRELTKIDETILPNESTQHEFSEDEDLEERRKLEESPDDLPQEIRGNGPSISRESCIYGSDCYRCNPSHKSTFAHPGDEDYVEPSSLGQSTSDTDDNRPECEYGIACYRQNPRHKREFKHTKKIQPKREVKRKAKKRKVDEYTDSEDDYDYEDPFLNDDSSDDYEPTDTDGESESDVVPDSQGTEEEDTKRMLKEAKKFVRKKA